MNSKKKMFIIALIIIVLGGLFAVYYVKAPSRNSDVIKEFFPAYKTLKSVISVNGIVEPENRIEINPPVSGRIEKIYVDEGDEVKAGDTLAIMSSTDRAALLDAARGQGADQVKYWENVYKPTPLIAPTNGQVIVREFEPGQTINTSTPILVLADKLIVKAQVDETDIGRVKKGQIVTIALDAYPDVKIQGKVSHISYESTVISNVTIYQVEIIPDNVPEIFRSGMSANVDIIRSNKENVLSIPEECINYQDNNTVVLIKNKSKKKYSEKEITIGLSENGYIVVLSGVSEKDILITTEKNNNKKKKSTSFFKRPGTKSKKK
jgi:membrane fusion protein, macrolide-specific efflux system